MRSRLKSALDLVGGFTALVQKGWTEGDRRLIEIMPEVFSTTKRVCGSVNVGSTAAGINMDAILALGRVLKSIPPSGPGTMTVSAVPSW